MKTKRNRIAFIHPAGYLNTVPGLMSAIIMLDERGYEIDVLMAEDHRFGRPKDLPQSVRLHMLRSNPWGSIAQWGLVSYRWFRFITSICRGKYVCYIGVDPYGLVLATVVAMLHRTKAVYFSLELLASADIRTRRGRVMKALERISNQKTVMSIIQDQDRAKQLIADNKISPKQIVIVPNSPVAAPKTEKSDFLRHTYAISNKEKIILSIGEICPRNLSLELVRSAVTWPDEMRLVLHSREQTVDNDYINEIKGIASRPNSHTILSLNPISFEELPSLVSSADLGVVLYSAAHPAIKLNMELVGLSSGKLSQYLHAGLPVIVTAYPSLKQLIDAYRFGLSIQHMHDIVPTMNTIFEHYDEFRKKAFDAFSALFDFRRSFTEVLRRLEHLA